uniref:Uncharacterized protein n=1 Tax=Heterorhabditis bacteriophora TaxID=37862 RepID=A0A1I7XC81_HETBA
MKQLLLVNKGAKQAMTSNFGKYTPRRIRIASSSEDEDVHDNKAYVSYRLSIFVELSLSSDNDDSDNGANELRIALNKPTGRIDSSDISRSSFASSTPFSKGSRNSSKDTILRRNEIKKNSLLTSKLSPIPRNPLSRNGFDQQTVKTIKKFMNLKGRNLSTFNGICIFSEKCKYTTRIVMKYIPIGLKKIK